MKTFPGHRELAARLDWEARIRWILTFQTQYSNEEQCERDAKHCAGVENQERLLV